LPVSPRDTIRACAIATFVVTLASGSAAAALDCGDTLPESVTLTEDLDCTGFPGTAITIGGDGVTLDGGGFRIIAPDAARAIDLAGHDGVTVRDVDLSGWCAGYGVYANGADGAVLEDLRIHGRDTAIYVANATSVTLRRVDVDAAATFGVQLVAVAQPIVFEDVALTNSGSALRLEDIVGPMTLDDDGLTSVSGSETGIDLRGVVSDLTLDGLTLDARSTGLGVVGSGAGITGLVVRNVDASGPAQGTGISVTGDVTLVDCVANDRSYGVYATGGGDYTLTRVSAARARVAGLTLSGVAPPLALDDLRLTDSATGLYLSNVDAAVTLGPSELSDLSGNSIAIYVTGSSGLTFDGLSIAGRSNAIQAANTANHGLTFSHLTLQGYHGGTGLQLGGADHVIDTVTSRDFGYGVFVNNVADVTIRHLDAYRNRTAGLYLGAMTTPPTLEDLRLTDNETGLNLTGVQMATSTAPLVIDPTVITALTGNDTDISISTSRYVELNGLGGLSGRTAGVTASNAGNLGLSFIDLTITGPQAGTGLNVGGAGALVQGVTVTDRATGIQLTGSGQIIDGVDVARCAVGVYVTSPTTSLGLSGLNLPDNGTALRLYGVDGDALEPVDGFVIDDTVLTSAAGSSIGLELYRYVTNLIVRDLILDNRGDGIHAQHATNANITFEDLDLSGHGAGIGLYLGGSGHTLTNVRADDRYTGVYANAAPGLTVTNLDARRCVNDALLLYNYAATDAPPTLTDLDLRDSLRGLTLQSFYAPTTIDAAAVPIGAVDGCGTGVQLSSYVQDVTLSGLTLPGTSYGVWAYNSHNERLRFVDLDLSGSGAGYGLNLQGTGHELDGVTVNDRQYGVYSSGVTDIAITDLTTARCATGLYLDGAPMASLQNLSLTDGGTGLYLRNLSTPWTLGAGALTDLDGNGTGIFLTYVTGATLRDQPAGLFSKVYNTGINLGSSCSDVTLDGVDVSGSGVGTGVALAGSGHALLDVIADDRAIGVSATSTADLTLDGVIVRRASRYGIHLNGLPSPPSLSDTTLTANRYGLYVQNLTGALTLAPAVFTAHLGNAWAFYVTGSAGVTVDGPGLALTEVSTGLWQESFGAPDALCGTSPPGDVTLTADLDCTGVPGTALTLAAGATLDGAGFRIVAPHATTVVSTGAHDDVTVRNVDVSQRNEDATGVLATGGARLVIEDVVADGLDYGVSVTGVEDLTLSGVSAADAVTTGVLLDSVALPLSVAGISTPRATTGLQLSDITGPFTLGVGSLTDASDTLTTLRILGGTDLTVEQLPLPGVAYGVRVTGATDGLLLDGVAVSSGRGRVGTGLTVGGGVDATLQDVTAVGRATGIEVVGTVPVVVRRPIATGCDTALALEDVAAGLTLEDAILGDSGTCLDLDGAQDLTLDDGALLSLSGCDTGVALTATTDVTVDGLTLDARVYGLDARAASNVRVTALDVDATGSGRGTGIHIGGTEPTVTGGTASRRAFGVSITGTSPTVDGVTANDAGRGIYVTTTSDVTLSALTATHCDDALTFHHLTGPYTLTPAAITSFAHSEVGLNVNNTSELTVDGLVPNGLAFDNPGYGIDTYNTGNADLVFRNLDLSGPRGVGIRARGDGILIEDVVADTRGAHGVVVGYASDVTARRVATHRCGTGLSFSNVALPLSFEDVTAVDGGTGLSLASISDPDLVGPLTLDTDGFSDLSGNDRSIILSSVQGVTVRGLSLDGASYGLHSDNATVGAATFEDLTLSGAGAGTGLALRGDGHTLTNLTASYRATGVQVWDCADLNVTGVTSVGAGLGFYTVYTNASATFTGLDCTNGGTGFRAHGMSGGTLDATMFSDLSGNATTLELTGGCSGVTVTGTAGAPLVLDGATAGLDADSAGLTGLTLRYLDASGPGDGTGIDLAGSGHVLEHVRADGRDTGVDVTDYDGLVATDVTVARAGSVAFTLYTLSPTPLAAPSLTGLSLTGSTIGLQVTGSRSPWTIDDTALVDVSGTTTAIDLYTWNTAVTVADLTLGNYNAVKVSDAYSYGLAFEDLDLTGSCRGTGLELEGSDHTVDRLVSARRTWGLRQLFGQGSTITDSSFGANATGINVSSGPAFVDTTVASSGANTAQTFKVASATYMAPGMTLRFGMPGGDEDRVYIGRNGATITLSTPLSGVPPVGTTIRSTDIDAPPPRLTVTQSDICANQTGLSTGVEVTIATDDYWQSGAGPVHTTNPGGDGDIVTGDGATVTPFDPLPNDVTDPYCNQVPVASAGDDQVVCEGDAVTLDASGSSDPDLEPLSYAWSQLAGTAVSLTSPDAVTAGFTAPIAGAQTLTFAVLVDDGDAVQRDTVDVVVQVGNQPPTAVAGADQAVDEGAAVALDGSASGDPEALPLGYAWVQTAGPAVTLVGDDTATPSFTAPSLADGGPSSVTLTFTLTVSDTEPAGACGGVRQAVDEVDVEVANLPDDNCPGDPDKTDPGVCGCGIPDVDSDGDGTLDCEDGCPADPDKTTPGVCGCGAPDGVDECASGAAGCDPDATCTELACGFDCACAEGFVGDGFTCTPIDSCEEQTAICGVGGAGGRIVWGVLDLGGALAGFRCEVAYDGAEPVCDTVAGTMTLRTYDPMCAP